MNRLGLFVLALLGLLIGSPGFASEADLRLTQRITDRTHTLSKVQINSLATSLANIERKNSGQVLVLLTNDIPDDNLEKYANDVFTATKIGLKGVDNGVLFIVSPKLHRSRLEIGRGLEGAIPDLVADAFQKERFNPYAKKGDIYGGIQSIVVALDEAINKEVVENPIKLQGVQPKESSGFDVVGFVFIIFLIGLVALFLFALAKTIFGNKSHMSSSTSSKYSSDSGYRRRPEDTHSSSSDFWSSFAGSVAGNIVGSALSGGGSSSDSGSSDNSWSSGGGSSDGGGSSSSWDD